MSFVTAYVIYNDVIKHKMQTDTNDRNITKRTIMCFVWETLNVKNLLQLDVFGQKCCLCSRLLNGNIKLGAYNNICMDFIVFRNSLSQPAFFFKIATYY